jgi:hypothetical protein
LKVAQERLGSSIVATALDLFPHIAATMQENAATRLDAALGDAIRAPSA